MSASQRWLIGAAKLGLQLLPYMAVLVCLYGGIAVANHSGLEGVAARMVVGFAVMVGGMALLYLGLWRGRLDRRVSAAWDRLDARVTGPGSDGDSA